MHLPTWLLYWLLISWFGSRVLWIMNNTYTIWHCLQWHSRYFLLSYFLFPTNGAVLCARKGWVKSFLPWNSTMSDAATWCPCHVRWHNYEEIMIWGWGVGKVSVVSPVGSLLGNTPQGVGGNVTHGLMNVISFNIIRRIFFVGTLIAGRKNYLCNLSCYLSW